MKTNTFLVIAIIAFSMFASNAFALLKSPYPRRASLPDDSLVIAENRPAWVQTTLRTSMNTLVTEQTIAVLAMSYVGLYTLQEGHQLFDQNTDAVVARNIRIEEVIFVYARMLLLRADIRAL